jgi:hypothetical protein
LAVGASGALGAGAGCSAVLGIDGLVADRDVADGGAFDRAPDTAVLGGGSDGGDVDCAPTCAAPCASPHDLCDDFDTSSIGDPTRWTELTTSAGGLLRRATDVFVSAPASMWATFPAYDAGDPSPTARLRKAFTGSVVGATCSFDIRVAAVDTQLIVWTFGVAPASDAKLDDYWIEWSLEGTRSRISAIGTTAAGGWDEVGGYFGLPTLRTWVHVVVNATRTTVAVTFDGNPVLTTQIALPSNTGAAFEFGAWTRDAVTSSNDVHVDNVVCDLLR